jgi:hypothetical protein
VLLQRKKNLTPPLHSADGPLFEQEISISSLLSEDILLDLEVMNINGDFLQISDGNTLKNVSSFASILSPSLSSPVMDHDSQYDGQTPVSEISNSSETFSIATFTSERDTSSDFQDNINKTPHPIARLNTSNYTNRSSISTDSGRIDYCVSPSNSVTSQDENIPSPSSYERRKKFLGRNKTKSHHKRSTQAGI